MLAAQWCGFLFEKDDVSTFGPWIASSKHERECGAEDKSKSTCTYCLDVSRNLSVARSNINIEDDDRALLCNTNLATMSLHSISYLASSYTLRSRVGREVIGTIFCSRSIAKAVCEQPSSIHAAV